MHNQEQQIQLDIMRQTLDDETVSYTVNSEITTPSVTIKRKVPQSGKASKYDWKDEMVEMLINLWRTQDVSYVTNANYHIKEKRRSAIEKICTKMEESFVNPVLTYEDILKKINTLRSYYVAERNNMENSKASGAATDSVYKSKWHYFK